MMVFLSSIIDLLVIATLIIIIINFDFFKQINKFVLLIVLAEKWH